MRYCGIGGQAVMEGVMMKNRDTYAVAVRKPDGEIEVKKENSPGGKMRTAVSKIPIVRGIVSFVDSLSLGMKTLTYSASFFEEEEKKNDQKKDDSLLMGIVFVVAIIAAIGLFVLVPFFLGESLKHTIRSAQIRGLIEGVIRVILFVIYVKAISLMDDIRRVFMYHGAEHKSINCIENGMELTVENVRKQSMAHKRCGTSFLLIVMFLSILLFMFISVRNIGLRMLFRILLIPLIAGLAYEWIRFAGRHDNALVNGLSKPGLWLQSLTTIEPDDSMIEVAIASVNAVFDWKSFLGEEEGIEILSLDEVDENDEILDALDRYFEPPK